MAVQPKNFDQWCLGAYKMGSRRMRVDLQDGKQKFVGMPNAPKRTAKLIQKFAPVQVEALDAEGNVLRQWSFTLDKEPDDEQTPGYAKETGDTEEERLLKTFAHLLADAHRVASKQLVEVVGIQANHFNEERKQLMTLRMQNEKLMMELSKRMGQRRVRVADAADEPAAEDEQPDTFMSDFLAPIMQKAMANYFDGQKKPQTPPAAPAAPANGGSDT